MLSDEEKKAIEKIKKILYMFPESEELKLLLNLIEKQSKEIEHQKEKRANQKKELAILNAKQVEFNKLVNTVNSYKGQFKRQQKEIEELKEEDDANLAYYDQIYQNGIYTGQRALENKIKAKIEDLKENSNGDDFNLTNVIMILQSLLEKE